MNRTLLFAMFLGILLVTGCATKQPVPEQSEQPPPQTPDQTFDTAAFLARFNQASTDPFFLDCADKANTMYLIDNQFVFWDVRGSCSDATYLFRLYDGSLDYLVCEIRDSIAGPVGQGCEPAFQELFGLITAKTVVDEGWVYNLDKPNLGLGAEHTVQLIADKTRVQPS